MGNTVPRLRFGRLSLLTPSMQSVCAIYYVRDCHTSSHLFLWLTHGVSSKTEPVLGFVKKKNTINQEFR